MPNIQRRRNSESEKVPFELENLEQLLQLASKENDIIVIKDCEKKTNLLLKQSQIMTVDINYSIVIASCLAYGSCFLGLSSSKASQADCKDAISVLTIV